MNITTVLPYHSGDYNLAKQLLEWIAELGKQPYAILLVGDSNVPTVDRLAMKAVAAKAFGHVEAIPVPVLKQGWPNGANQMWIVAAKYIEANYKTPWLWLEPDAVPLNENWHILLDLAYKSQPKLFMGHIENSTAPGLPSKHLAGVAIYPVNAHSIMASQIKDGQAFDISCSPAVVQKSTHTDLIHHFWGEFNLAPTFVKERTPESPKNAFTLKNIKPEAVIFHRCKDGTLIPLLREHREATKTTEDFRGHIIASAEPGFPTLAEVHQLEGFQGSGPITAEPSPVECQNTAPTAPLPQPAASDTPVKRKPGRPKKVTAS